jgi:hypothetical protein
MFSVSQVLLEKFKLTGTDNVVTYSIVIGISLYAGIYAYLLFKQPELLPMFNKFILFVVGIDCLISTILYIRQNHKNVLDNPVELQAFNIEDEDEDFNVYEDDSDGNEVDYEDDEDDEEDETDELDEEEEINEDEDIEINEDHDEIEDHVDEELIDNDQINNEQVATESVGEQLIELPKKKRGRPPKTLQVATD